MVLLGAFFVACAALAVALSSAREVDVDVTAPWKQYPGTFTVEVGEMLASYSPDLFERDNLSVNAAYWQYVQGLCGQSLLVDAALRGAAEKDLSESESERERLDSLSLSLARSLLPASLASLAESALRLGEFAAASAFYESLSAPLGDPCAGRAFLVHTDTHTQTESVSCDAAELLSSLSRTPTSAQTESVSLATLRDWDHLVLSTAAESASPPLAHVALYGAPGESSFCAALHTLTPAVQSGAVHALSLRPSFVGQRVIASERALQGYGVFLDIKNMEYKNVDDGDVAKAAQSEQETSFPENEEIEGVNFSRLFAHNPSAERELRMLREELLSHSSSSSSSSSSAESSAGGEMKVWKIRDLGLQLLQRFNALKQTQSPAQVLRWLSETINDFPRFASSLSRVKVLSSLRRDIERWTEGGVEAMLPRNTLFINGRGVPLDGNTFNLFDTLAVVREELRQSERLRSVIASARERLAQMNASFSLSPETLSALPSSPSPSVSSVKANTDGSAAESEEDEKNRERVSALIERSVGPLYRVDVSRGSKHAVSFVNNLEKDSLYRHWPRTLRTLLQPSWSLHTLQRNLYTLVLVIDVFSVQGARLLLETQAMLAQQFPVRVGLSFKCADDDQGKTENAHNDFCRLFSFLKEKDSVRVAAEFATMVAENTLTLADEGAFSVEREGLLRLAKTAASKKLALKDAFSSTEGQYFVSNSTAFLTARNLPMNSFSLNGIVSAESDLQSGLMPLLGREQYILALLVRENVLSDKRKSLSIFTELLKYSRTTQRFHALLSEKTPVYLDLLSAQSETLCESLSFVSLSSQTDTNTNDKQAQSLQPEDSVIAVVPSSRDGVSAALASLSFLSLSEKSARNTRVAIVWRESDAGTETDIKPSVGECAADENGQCLLSENPHSLSLSTLDRVLLLSLMSSLAAEAPLSRDTFSHAERLLREVSEGKDFLSVLRNVTAPLTESQPLALFSQRIEREIASEVDRESFVQKERKVLKDSERSVDAALSSSLSLSPSEALVVLNGRVLRSPALALHTLDISLLRDLDGQRVSALEHALSSSLSMSTDAHTDAHRDAQRELSSLFMRLSASRALAPSLAAGGSPSQRAQASVDVDGILREHLGDAADALTLSLTDTQTDAHTDTDTEGEKETTTLSVRAVLDPLSLAGRRGLSLLHALRSLSSPDLSLSLSLCLVPATELQEFPLQSFFRFVAYTQNTGETQTPRAHFTSLPRQHTLTLRLDVPEPWNVQRERAKQDVDNLRCVGALCGDDADSPELTRVTYALKDLLVAGQCLQTTQTLLESTNSLGAALSVLPPPNGLQLELHTLSPSHTQTRRESENNTESLPVSVAVADTVVMQNLGYYQLRAQPGLFSLSLAQGRASALYRVLRDTHNALSQSSSYTESAITENENDGQVVAVKDFSDNVRRLIVVKKREREHEPLLQSDDHDLENGDGANEESDSSLWNSLTSSLFGKKNKHAVAKARRRTTTGDGEDERVHVFSLATGHLYERLLRIMMLSVVKHCSRPVTFWLFENYLSPAFKQSALAMSARFGFEVRFVTYKWPQWLTQQQQQQRIIWGYKILFLDVLFPLDLKRIIYVDADQVVRSDLAELWDMDLEGKPYGYTPFCTSRQETLGFQFWRSGYWKDHLQGRPYHISALYVVDLSLFRRMAVGDSLRAIYQQLSRDPNSLANLDQDLPNYAQHQVPIHSLPQEWLWCESWCSDDSKAKAKTIDLCNNPLHKESKLDMAKRVISGPLFNQSWIELDEEIKSFIHSEGLLSAGAE